MCVTFELKYEIERRVCEWEVDDNMLAFIIDYSESDVKISIHPQLVKASLFRADPFLNLTDRH